MIITVERKYFKDTYTIGRMYLDGVYFCDTLEDKNRDINKDGDLTDKNESKVFGETCIPFGRYEVVVNYSPKFKRHLPRLLNVPHFDGILIHNGVTAKNSHGCILVGKNKIKGGLVDSKSYMNILTDRLIGVQKRGEKILIEIE